MRPFTAHLVWLLLLCVSSAAQPQAPAAPASAGSAPRVGPPAEEIARGMSAGKTFPIDVDEWTRLVSVTGRGSTLTSRYVVKKLPEGIPDLQTMRQRMQQEAEVLACQTPGSVRLLERGYTMEMVYALGEPPAEVTVRLVPGLCPRRP